MVSSGSTAAFDNFSTIAVWTAIVIVLLNIFQPKKIQLILKSHRERREIRKLCAQKDDDNSSSSSTNEQDDDSPRVSGILIHPIKSMRAVSIPETKFDKHGLLSDRRLMLVRPLPTPLHGSFAKGEATHRFFTQRQAPSLATIELKPVLSQDRTKILLKLSSASNQNDYAYIDTHPNTIKTYSVKYLAGVWSDVVEVADVGDDAAEYVASIVCKDDPSFKDVRVVTILESSVRKVNEQYCPDAARVGLFADLPEGGLTDGFPILVATEASLELLNQKLKQKGKEESIPMSRFRPNIVISNTSKAFDEDNWKAIKIGRGKDAVILHLVKGCPRCKQSCTDQLTGERGEEPVATLSEFRALGKSEEDVYFAQNAVLNGDSYNKVIHVGDPVTILTKGEAVWDMEDVQAE